MNPSTKIHVAKATLSLLLAVVSVFLLGLLILVVCAGFQINPFRETTTSFLVSAFLGLIGVAVVLVLLNVATNLSLIADAQIANGLADTRPSWLKKWFWGFSLLAVVTIAFIFVGTYLSKRRYVTVVREQAEDVLRNNTGLLEEASHLLASGKRDDFDRIMQIRDYLISQRSNLPQLTLIYYGKFDEKPAFFRAHKNYDFSTSSHDPKEYLPEYYSCTPNLDCDYLRKFFSGDSVGTLEHFGMRDDQFHIYIPYIGKEARYILLFERVNQYGKFGS